MMVLWACGPKYHKYLGKYFDVDTFRKIHRLYVERQFLIKTSFRTEMKMKIKFRYDQSH